MAESAVLLDFKFLEPMLIEPGLGTSQGRCDHLASDEPEAHADLAHLNPGSGCGLVATADTFISTLGFFPDLHPHDSRTASHS
jgi:hypothetical protein